MKKALCTALTLSFLFMNILPVRANIQSSKLSKKEAKVLKAKTERFNYINMPWWEEYNDEYLKEYILKAFEHNQDLKIATLQVEESRQRTKLQFAKELPTLSAGVAPSLYKLPGVTSTAGAFAVPIIANYEIDIFLKNHDKTKSSKKLYEAEKLNEKAAYIAISSAVGSTYYNIVNLDEQIRLQEILLKDREEIYKLMKMRNEAGITSTADLTRADKARTLAKSELYDLQKNRLMLLNSLAVLTGDSPENAESFKRISYADLSKEKNIPEYIPSDIITKRPDYLVAEKMVEKAGIDVRVAKKEFLPNLNILGLVAFLNDSRIPGGMSWGSSLGALGGSAILDIFAGGAKIANLKINKINYDKYLQNYYKTNLTAIKEVNDSLLALKSDNNKYLTNLKTLNLEKKDFGFSTAEYNYGVKSKLDWLQRRENLTVIQKVVTANKIDCYIDQISLYKAVAGADL
jgi:NodT family efflux transporter outer membrane factor (OMF) lipoprotein